jgi:hypothetical protein
MVRGVRLRTVVGPRPGEGCMRASVCFVLICAMSAANAWGQATAQIHGTVQDMSGAAVAGATVKSMQTDTGVSRVVRV